MRIFGLIALALFVGCLLDSDTSVKISGGKYDLVANDDDGTVAHSGWIRLVIDKKGGVTGAWELTDMDGDGNLVGTVESTHVSLSLHPGWADHNMFMNGEFRDREIRGTWEFIGFAGPMEGGTFVATR